MTTCPYPQLIHYNITSFSWSIMKLAGQNVLSGRFLASILPKNLLTQLQLFLLINSPSIILLRKAFSLYNLAAFIRHPIRYKPEILLSPLELHATEDLWTMCNKSGLVIRSAEDRE